MKKILLPLALILVAFGCATHPLTEKKRVIDNGQTNVVYAPAAWLTNAIEGSREVNRAIPASPATPLVDLILGAATLGLGLYARFQTVKANQQSQAADLLAATIVQAGKSNEALRVSSGTKSHQTVAQHIDNNTL